MIRLVIPDVIPLIKTANELVVVASALELINETGADTTPLTLEVKVLVVVEMLFVVLLASNPLTEVVEIIPFTLETRLDPDVVSELVVLLAIAFIVLAPSELVLRVLVVRF